MIDQGIRLRKQELKLLAFCDHSVPERGFCPLVGQNSVGKRLEIRSQTELDNTRWRDDNARTERVQMYKFQPNKFSLTFAHEVSQIVGAPQKGVKKWQKLKMVN